MQPITETKIVLVPTQVEFEPSLDQLSFQVGQPSKPAVFSMIVAERAESKDVVQGTEKLYQFPEADDLILLIREGQVTHGEGTAAERLQIPPQITNLNDAANFIYARRKAQIAAATQATQAEFTKNSNQ